MSAQSAPVRILGRSNSFNVRKILWVCDEMDMP
ncbi:MAG TPA: glutathione S-transferase family protein, partial [Rhodospirillaceae bacterium]|nr:glutathione S-transferase family protein [Rhodospirillaceae bacterium]